MRPSGTSAARRRAAPRSSTRMMRSIGLVDTEMYGGYSSTRSAARRVLSPVRSRFGSTASRRGATGRRRAPTTSRALLRAVWLASGGTGPLRAAQPGFTAADARYLLYLLAHVRDPGKLDREVGRIPGVRVLHKAGWINDARHDNGIVFWRGGAYVVTVMTYRVRGSASRPTCSRARRRGGAAPLPRLSRPRSAELRSSSPRAALRRSEARSRRPNRLGLRASAEPENEGARKRAPMLAVMPSECATARRCPAPGGDIREAGLQQLRLGARRRFVRVP